MLTVTLFILGLLVGSFLNVLIYRLPRGIGFVKGRSACPHCEKQIAWYDLMPVISFVLLHGRCRNCHAPISFQYPLIEIISGIFFVFAPSIIALILLEIFLVIAVIDYQHLIIPDSLVIIVGLVGLFQLHLFTALASAGFFGILWLISNGRWIGFGDVKLAGALGLFFGFPATLLIIYIAIMVGGAVGLVLMATRRATMKTALPFGSLLCVSAGVYLFYGDAIRIWAMQLVRL